MAKKVTNKCPSGAHILFTHIRSSSFDTPKDTELYNGFIRADKSFIGPQTFLVLLKH